LEPTVYAIGSTSTILKIKRLPSFERAPPGVAYPRKIIRMSGVAGGPILQFLSRLAKIFQDLAVEKLDLARAAHEDLAADPHLDLPWTPDLSTVTFRLRTGDTRRLLDRIHATSTTMLSATTVDGRDLIRLCVLSHRSHAEHVDQALDAIHRAARPDSLAE